MHRAASPFEKVQYASNGKSEQCQLLWKQDKLSAFPVCGKNGHLDEDGAGGHAPTVIGRWGNTLSKWRWRAAR